MEELRVRPLRPNDVPACLALFDGHVPQYFRSDERAGFETFLAALPGPYFVMEDPHGNVLACGGVAVEDDGKVGSLCWGIVHHGQQRKRLGSLLALVRINELVDTLGCEIIRLETISTTEGFFETLGFVTLRREVNGHAPGIDRVDMELSITEETKALIKNRLSAEKEARGVTA